MPENVTETLQENVTGTLGELADQTGIADVFAPIFQGFTLQKLLYILVLIVVCVTVVKLLLRLVDRFLARGKIDLSLHTFIRTISKFVLWFLAIIIIVGALGVQITSLVAVLSVIGLAVSLAVQGALSNLAGGVQVLTAKPFKVGDYIAASGVEGKVQEITLVHTKLVTVDNKLIFVPNSEMSAAKVTNYTAEPRRRVDLVFSTSYEDRAEQVIACIKGVIAAHPRALAEPEPFVRVSAYKESCVDYTVRVWCETEHYWDLYFDLLEQVKAAFDRDGIQMTYNHLNVHMISGQ
ncbi:mechanosensitive ion channel domain-containing protein [Lawsonibacter celer]|uniref:mechanosensitive ion channel domain-containing protein n=1 Tax=Lawsonibacter celer TaxID=2986526 RepID=UPI0016491A07